MGWREGGIEGVVGGGRVRERRRQEEGRGGYGELEALRYSWDAVCGFLLLFNSGADGAVLAV